MSTSQSKKIESLYSLGHARWYNPFKGIWNRLVSKQAENEFSKFINANIDSSKNILELGCGSGLNLDKISSHKLSFKKYFGLDISPDMLNIARNNFKDLDNINFIQTDITKLQDYNNKFDIIISTWVLSHLDNPAFMINHAQNYLKDGGKMFLIFLSKPKWYINFWFCILSKYLFQSICLDSNEISKFKNINFQKSFVGNITTVIEINK